MPLPNAGEAWPPKALEKVTTDLARWSAWWCGSADELSRVYGGYAGTTEESFASNGLLGSARNVLQRWFWGTPPKPGERQAKLHVPVAAEIAEMSADLIFGQPPSITCEHDRTQARLDDLIADRASSQLRDAAEACAALGHTYLRVGWDREVDPTGPLLSVVDADAAVPVYRYGHLMAVTFCREWEESGTVLRHLELHEPGIIWHAAYLGDHTSLGRMVPLQAHPETADLAEDGMVSDDRREGSGIETGIEELAVVGVANARSRTWRHIPEARDLGRADISGVEADLDALDDVYSSWLRDVRHGRSRLHVPNHMLESNGVGKGATFDLDRELYIGLNTPPDGDLQLTPTQFNIRWEEHANTARALIERIVSGAGYSLQTFGMDQATNAQTATESWARQIRTQHTRNGKLRHWNPAVLQLCKVMLAVDNAQFGGTNDLDAPIEVQFADTVSESQLVRAQTAQMLRAAEAASTRTLVEMVHNDRDGEWQDEEVRRIESGRDDPDTPDEDAGTEPVKIGEDPDRVDPNSHDFPGSGPAA